MSNVRGDYSLWSLQTAQQALLAGKGFGLATCAGQTDLCVCLAMHPCRECDIDAKSKKGMAASL